MCSALQKKATFPQMLDILQLFVDPVVVQCSRTTNKHIQIYLTSLVSAVGFWTAEKTDLLLQEYGSIWCSVGLTLYPPNFLSDLWEFT